MAADYEPSDDAAMDRQRVVVIGGGQNSEHEVSLASAAEVATALDPARFHVTPITIDLSTVCGDGEHLNGAIPGTSLASASGALRPTPMSSFQSSMDHTARTAPLRRCANWPARRTSAAGCGPVRWPWTSGRPNWRPKRSAYARQWV